MDQKLNAKQLRTSTPLPSIKLQIPRRDIFLILDSVLDTYNVGAIFRLADATGVKEVFLCGQTETPPNPKIKKASVNTWQWVKWTYCNNAAEAVENLSNRYPPIKIVAIEQNKKSIIYSDMEVKLPIALILGNESSGLSKEVLKLADEIIELPMYGVNKSLNVMVCTGIVLYQLLEKITK